MSLQKKQIENENDQISEVDKLKLCCRLCLAPEQDVQLCSPYQDSITYIDVLQQLADIEVVSTDCLPKKICMECASKLVLFYKFRKKIETSQITLSVTLQDESEPMKIEEFDVEDEIETSEKNVQIDDECKEESNANDDQDNSEFFDEFVYIDDVIEDSYTEIAIEQNSPPDYIDRHDTAAVTIVGTTKKLKKQTEHQCDECGRVFTRKSVLDQHKNTHSGIKNFSCDICKSWFTRRSHLHIHMRIHENLKPYICEICSRGFRKSGDLARHRRIHFSDRNYPCSMCEKRFKRATDVTSHMRTHTKDKPYRCRQPKCDKTYTSHSSLRKHETRKHEKLFQSSSLMANDKSNVYEITE